MRDWYLNRQGYVYKVEQALTKQESYVIHIDLAFLLVILQLKFFSPLALMIQFRPKPTPLSIQVVVVFSCLVLSYWLIIMT